MALSSVLCSAQESTVRELLLVDASEEGIGPRKNDLLNMARQLGWRVIVLRTRKEGHHAEFAKGLELAKVLGWSRVHHFDGDVVVLPAWFKARWDDSKVEALQLMESSGSKGFLIAQRAGEATHVAAAAMSFHVDLLTTHVMLGLWSHELSIFEDIKFCRLTGVPSQILAGVGVMHSTRDTGGAYVAKVVKLYAEGTLSDKPTETKGD